MVDRKLAQRGKETSNRNYWNDLFSLLPRYSSCAKTYCCLFIVGLFFVRLALVSIDFVEGFHLSFSYCCLVEKEEYSKNIRFISKSCIGKELKKINKLERFLYYVNIKIYLVTFGMLILNLLLSSLSFWN